MAVFNVSTSIRSSSQVRTKPIIWKNLRLHASIWTTKPTTVCQFFPDFVQANENMSTACYCLRSVSSVWFSNKTQSLKGSTAISVNILTLTCPFRVGFPFGFQILDKSFPRFEVNISCRDITKCQNCTLQR